MNTWTNCSTNQREVSFYFAHTSDSATKPSSCEPTGVQILHVAIHLSLPYTFFLNVSVLFHPYWLSLWPHLLFSNDTHGCTVCLLSALQMLLSHVPVLFVQAESLQYWYARACARASAVFNLFWTSMSW